MFQALAAGATFDRMAPDQDPVRDHAKARRILFDTYWTPNGWRRPPVTSDADRQYATAAGYMFPPSAAGHDEWIHVACAVRDRTTLADVAAAFVASLSRRALAQRSALGSLASTRHLRPHAVRRWAAMCGECGVSDRVDRDMSVLNFERHKWGGVRHGDAVYAAFDLEQFERSERAVETDEDVAILNAILDAARGSAVDDHPRDLERRIAALLPSNKAEREILLGILALCDVFATPEHPGLLARWVPIDHREPPPKPAKNDWLYPMFWWRGAIGVNEDAARAVFGERVR